MEYLITLIVGFIIGCYAYTLGYRAQTPFYKVFDKNRENLLDPTTSS